MNLSALSTYGREVITFLGTLGTFTAAVQTNSDLTGSGTPGWTYLVGLGLSALTTFLASKKGDPRVRQVEAVIAELEKVIEKANTAPASSAPVVPVDVVTTGTEILDEISKVIQTFKTSQK